MNILVIGDSHIEVGQPLDRFKALGNFILDQQPKVIISIGDFLTLDSLSEWDKDNRKAMENRRYSEEIKVGNQALDLMSEPMWNFNQRNKRSKKKQYLPRLIYIHGNHEARLTRYLNKNPVWLNHIGIEKDLKLKMRGFENVSYKHHIYINGICFTHIPISFNGRPITGKYITTKALDLYTTSVVFGHTHSLNVGNRYRHGQAHLQQALNCGCFFEEEPEWITGAPAEWWKGICILDNYDFMRFDLTTISMSQLKSKYL